MSGAPLHSRLPPAVIDLLESRPFTSVVATCAIAVVFFSHAVRSLIGWPGLIAAVTVLVGLAVAVVIVRREQFEWHGILPITLLAFVGWSGLSVFWSDYQWATLAGIGYQFGVAALAVFVAVARDLIQVVRALGDVLRCFLAGSLAAEVFAGVLIDSPIPFLGVAGNLATGGPIQGLAGARNLLGIIATIAVVTFAVELITRSVTRPLAGYSLAMAVITVFLTRSPVSLATVAVVALAAVVLLLVRRTPAERRLPLQVGIGGFAAVTGLVSLLLQDRLIQLFNSRDELSLRIALWDRVGQLADLNSILGWGWVGAWRTDLVPFLVLRTTNGRIPTSALNSYLDVLFQLGIVGAAIFIGFIGLAVVRAWLVASNRRNIAHIWPALVLALLVTVGFVESTLLIEFCWFVLVVCAIKAAQELSWRRGLR